jgi:hypothetical protein
MPLFNRTICALSLIALHCAAYLLSLCMSLNTQDCSFVHLLFAFVEQVKISDWLMPDRVEHIMEYVLKMMCHPRSLPAQVNSSVSRLSLAGSVLTAQFDNLNGSLLYTLSCIAHVVLNVVARLHYNKLQCCSTASMHSSTAVQLLDASC